MTVSTYGTVKTISWRLNCRASVNLLLTKTKSLQVMVTGLITIYKLSNSFI